MKIKIDPVFGFELECAYNPEKIGPIRLAGHHSQDSSATYSNSFFCESDGSLNTNSKYSQTAEIISVPFSLDSFDRVMQSFYDHTLERYYSELGVRSSHSEPGVISGLFRSSKRDKVPELGDIFNFNNTCGCHIHITPLVKSNKRYYANFKGKKFSFKGTPIKIKHLATLEFMELIRNKVHKKIESEMPGFYDTFAARYFRAPYAEKPNSVHETKISRYKEFNLSTSSDTHMEFRSFHITGIDTWESFNKVLKITLETIKECFEFEINKSEAFKEAQTIDLKYIKKNYKSEDTCDRTINVQHYDSIIELNVRDIIRG